jgi:hypothetical protein
MFKLQQLQLTAQTTTRQKMKQGGQALPLLKGIIAVVQYFCSQEIIRS